MFSTSKNRSYSHRRKKAILGKGYPFPMRATEFFAIEMFCLSEEYFYSLRLISRLIGVQMRNVGE